MSLKLHVVFHGAEPAFMRQPGCPCVRCREPEPPPNPTPRDFAHLLAWLRQAHTSASLVVEQDGVMIDQTLVDVGMGVVNNLVALPTPARGQPVTRLLLTHGHMDHIGGLDGLLYSLELARRSGDLAPDAQPWPLPVFATRLTWQRCVGPNPDDPTNPGHFYHNLHQMTHVDITAAARDLTALQLHPALTVTPIPVEHLYDSVNYLFTFWPSGRQGEGDPVRVALCWDHRTVPAGRGDDVWQGIALDPRREPLSELMRDLDLLAVEMNTWHIYGHISFVGGIDPNSGEVAPYGVRDLIQWWRPRVTRIVHYSGWDDRRLSAGRSGANGSWLSGEAVRENTDPAHGPVGDDDLLRALHGALGESVAIDLAHAGEVLTFS